MKNLIIILSLICSFSFAQDNTLIVVNVSNDPSLYYKATTDGSPSIVKRKATLIEWKELTNKEFYIKLSVTYYKDNAGSYGSRIIDLIQADAGLSSDQKFNATEQFKDRIIEYQTNGKYVDSTTGLSVNQFQPDGITPTVGAVTDLTYWQAFKLNQVPGMGGSLSTQGAMDAGYKVKSAIIGQMATRKNF